MMSNLNLYNLKIELDSILVASKGEREFLEKLLDYLQKKEDRLEEIITVNNLYREL